MKIRAYGSKALHAIIKLRGVTTKLKYNNTDCFLGLNIVLMKSVSVAE